MQFVINEHESLQTLFNIGIFMRRNLTVYKQYQVFLNYPFDEDFEKFANAMHFAVIAAGLLPVCARELSLPDKLRIDLLFEMIDNCHYSAHDLSRSTGESSQNLARMNMPFEMGMALFYALQSKGHEHRCAFFVPDAYTYQKFISDLAGLDPKNYNNDEEMLLISMYEWLRDVVPPYVFSSQPPIQILNKFRDYNKLLKGMIDNNNNRPFFRESQELMYQICSEAGWWDWRMTKAGREELPQYPID